MKGGLYDQSISDLNYHRKLLHTAQHLTSDHLSLDEGRIFAIPTRDQDRAKQHSIQTFRCRGFY